MDFKFKWKFYHFELIFRIEQVLINMRKEDDFLTCVPNACWEKLGGVHKHDRHARRTAELTRQTKYHLKNNKLVRLKGLFMVARGAFMIKGGG